MLRLILALILPFITASSVLAVTWDTVSLSFIAEKFGDTVAKSHLTTQSYIKLVSIQDDIPARDLFVGYNESTGEMCVVQISTQSIRYSIVYDLNGQTKAVNASETKGSVVASATVATLSTNLVGNFYDVFQKNPDGTFKTVKRTVIGFDSLAGATLIGTARIQGKRYRFP